MSSILTINIDDLLYLRGVESARVEFKASWDEETTAYQILKTICAFANDLQNLNGGYIVIGVAEENGSAILPPKGIPSEQLDDIQKWIRGNCNRIDPEYQPVISPERPDGKDILVIWVPGSDVRPHKAPDGKKGEKKYWVRIGSETVDAAKNGVLDQLLHMTARVPFDSRRALHAKVEDLRESKVREFLRDIRSGLLDEPDTKELYRKLRIAAPVNGYDVPINVGLLFFSEDPEQWFPGARIEVVQFAGDASGDVQEERIFKGPIHEQIRDCLNYLKNLSTTHLEKVGTDIRVRGWVSYPIPALDEAIVNAVYHRGYEGINEPIKVYLYPDRMEIISYPGPVPGIQLEHLRPGASVPPVPARNRRIGEFLKELRLAEGRGTGLPKIFRAMRENGSPEPVFDFDEGRTFFRATLPAHPEYVAISTLRDVAHLRAVGDIQGAKQRLEDSWKANPSSALLAGELIRLYGKSQELPKAEQVFKEFRNKAPEAFLSHVINVMVNAYFECGEEEKARELLKDLPAILSASDAFDTAILARRLGNQEIAHKYFEQAGDSILNDPRALHEFAQTKIDLARKIWRNRHGSWGYRRQANKRLLTEAKQLLERVVQMDASPTRHAWAWRDLARVLNWLRAPKREVVHAYKQAISLLPNEKRFRDELGRISDTTHGR